MTLRCKALLGLLALLLALSAQGLELQRIEPPNWWVGMKDPRLQLLVHGPGIGAASVSSGHAALRITGVQRVTSPNYLLIDARVAPGPKAVSVPLRFVLKGQTKTVAYELRAREPGSAQRRGFDASDVILNLVPDRFANGDPANDDAPGMLEKANRAEKSSGRHGGDIQGIIDHLDYIQAMGYTMLWPTPLTENNQPAYSYHGYAATDTYRIDPRLGTNNDYRRLAREAKRRGIGLIMDFVPNHIGSGHWWMQDPPTPDWLNNGGRFKPTNHARTSVSDRYASRADERAFTEGWFVDAMPDPNQRNPLVARYQTQNAIWWIEDAGLAGLRIDTYGYSDKAFLTAFTRRLMHWWWPTGCVVRTTATGMSRTCPA
jgi:neopullulanase